MSEKEASRPVSCFGDIELSYDEPEGGNVNTSDGAHQQVERRRTPSVNDTYRMKLKRDDEGINTSTDNMIYDKKLNILIAFQHH